MSLIGSFQPPGDKSVSHRIGLISLLAQGVCRVQGYSQGQDCLSTLGAVRALGGGADWQGDELVLTGADGQLTPKAVIDCGNSGTTIRFLMGILAGVQGEYTLDGDESLRRRPMERVAKPLRAMGARVECNEGRPPVRIGGGRLSGAEHQLPVASAQLKSALLLAGMQAQGQTLMLSPHPSRDHTERMLAAFGADIQEVEQGQRIGPSRLTLPENFLVPADPSSAAFFLCAAAIIPGSQVTAQGVMLNPTRTGFLKVLERMGAEVRTEVQGRSPEPWGSVQVRYSPDLQGCRISAAELPSLVDEVPILALTASQAQGVTLFEEVDELRVKESDRVAAIISQLGAMGAHAKEQGRDLVVEGPVRLAAPDELDALGDHRMAMTLRLASVLAGGDPVIKHEESVAISYPGFARTLKELSS